jgi:5-methylcytosine-specific restriction enzyme subunit McrC
MTTPLTIDLHEWEQRHPDPGSPLAGIGLDDTPGVRELAQHLTRSGILVITELRSGLDLAATSYVGRVTLGRMQITIRPKLRGLPFLTLLRYAYDLRQLSLPPPTTYDTERDTFQELLIAQLVAEADELLARGLLRGYVPRAESLASPRGRIDMQLIARRGGIPQARLPCIWHPRIDNTHINQVLLQGLLLGAQLTGNPAVRTHLRRQAAWLQESVTSVPLTWQMLQRAHRALNRLTVAYQPALTIITLLFKATGISLDSAGQRVQVPGLLFDMNHFFQMLVGRFLREQLVGYTLQEEYRLYDMFRYAPGGNPRHRQAPTPRPDYAVQQAGKVVALLDAKYRDLWEQSLPAHMLYQLAIYALSRQPAGQATMLYPTLQAEVREAHLDIRHPATGYALGRVTLRPVPLDYLAELVADPSSHRKRETLARRLVFGA